MPFTWTFHLIPEWFCINALLLITYFALATRAYAKESPEDLRMDDTNITPIRLRGAINFIFFAMIIVAVAVVPSMNLEAIQDGSAAWHEYLPLREIVFLIAVIGSFVFGTKEIRYKLN